MVNKYKWYYDENKSKDSVKYITYLSRISKWWSKEDALKYPKWHNHWWSRVYLWEWLKDWELIKKDAHESLTHKIVYHRLYHWRAYHVAVKVPRYKRRSY